MYVSKRDNFCGLIQYTDRRILCQGNLVSGFEYGLIPTRIDFKENGTI